MIQILEIEDPIAEDVWTVKGSDGQITSHRIVVGYPHPENDGDDKSAWYCPVLIEGFTSRIVPAMGVGSVDSLMNAMTLVKSFFEKHRDDFADMGK